MPLRSQQILAGIQGFASGGNAIVNLDLNKRFHGLNFFLSTGASAPAAPSSVLNWVTLDINGTKMLDWTPAIFTEAAKWDGYQNQLETGQLFIPFSLPRFLGFRDNTATSFDLAGQTSAQLTMSLQTGLTTPNVLALQEYDFQRNQIPFGPNKGQYFLRPLKRLRQSFTISGSNAGGLGAQTDITQIPITNPIRRLILIPDNAGTISHYEIIADGVKVDEGDTQTGSAQTWINDATARQYANGVGNNGSAYNNTARITYPLSSVVIDFTYTKRLADALTCKNSLILRVWSNNNGNQNLTIGEEFIANAYK